MLTAIAGLALVLTAVPPVMLVKKAPPKRLVEAERRMLALPNAASNATPNAAPNAATGDRDEEDVFARIYAHRAIQASICKSPGRLAEIEARATEDSEFDWGDLIPWPTWPTHFVYCPGFCSIIASRPRSPTFDALYGERLEACELRAGTDDIDAEIVRATDGRPEFSTLEEVARHDWETARGRRSELAKRDTVSARELRAALDQFATRADLVRWVERAGLVRGRPDHARGVTVRDLISEAGQLHEVSVEGNGQPPNHPPWLRDLARLATPELDAALFDQGAPVAAGPERERFALIAYFHGYQFSTTSSFYRGRPGRPIVDIVFAYHLDPSLRLLNAMVAHVHSPSRFGRIARTDRDMISATVVYGSPRGLDEAFHRGLLERDDTEDSAD